MAVPTISAFVLAFLRQVARRYFKRQFHAVRISGAEWCVYEDGPLIIYANHGSWWDPMVLIMLAKRYLNKQRNYAPMDAESMERYGILKRIGIFPVELKTQRGAVQFLRTGEEILKDGGVLWITPQGRFVDQRERPLAFKPGLAALAHRVAAHGGACTVLPLAIEYTFWDERLPETLLLFGRPVRLLGSETLAEVQGLLITALEEAMEALKTKALLRDPRQFETLLGGRSGAGGFYAVGQRLKAILKREPYQPDHTKTARVPIVGE